METHQRRRFASDVSADSTSSESLSFAGLLSIQDLHSKSPIAHSFNNTKNHNQGFEFSFSTTECSANNLNRMSSTKTSISNGQHHQIQLQALLRQSSKSQKPGSKAVTRRNNKQTNDNGKDEVKVSNRTKHRARNQEKKECAASSPSLGKKIFQSFFSPCRECHTHKPTAKEKSMPRETVRAY